MTIGISRIPQFPDTQIEEDTVAVFRLNSVRSVLLVVMPGFCSEHHRVRKIGFGYVHPPSLMGILMYSGFENEASSQNKRRDLFQIRSGKRTIADDAHLCQHLLQR